MKPKKLYLWKLSFWASNKETLVNFFNWSLSNLLWWKESFLLSFDTRKDVSIILWKVFFHKKFLLLSKCSVLWQRIFVKLTFRITIFKLQRFHEKIIVYDEVKSKCVLRLINCTEKTYGCKVCFSDFTNKVQIFHHQPFSL